MINRPESAALLCGERVKMKVAGSFYDGIILNVILLDLSFHDEDPVEQHEWGEIPCVSMVLDQSICGKKRCYIPIDKIDLIVPIEKGDSR